MFVVIVHYIKALTEIEPLIQVHREFLAHGYELGILLCSGPQVPRHGGIILAKAPDRETLMNFLRQDPFYRAKVAEYQVLEFTPTQWAEYAHQIFNSDKFKS